MGNDNSDHIDIATQLLNSNDMKIAAAAKRIFSPRAPSSPPLQHTHRETEQKEDISTFTLNNGLSVPDVSKRLRTAPIVSVMHETPCPNLLSFSISNHSPDVVNLSVGLPAVDNVVDESPFNSLNRILRAEDEINKKFTTPHERLQRSRERNKIHARRTRQRKKEHMQNLEKKTIDLKEKQRSLKLLINEKNTASILMAMFSTEVPLELKNAVTDSRIEYLLKRPTEGIPDASKIPELPTLVLPGHHNNRKREFSSFADKETNGKGHGYPDDGIDYDLLAKDRSKCTSTELDKIRRERNRMHAKRTRERKKRFMDEMEGILKQLSDENELLSDHLRILTGKHVSSSGDATPSLASPKIGSCYPTTDAPPAYLGEGDSDFYNIMKGSCPTNLDTVIVSDDGANSDSLVISPQTKQRASKLYDVCVPTSITTMTNSTHNNSLSSIK